MTKLLIVSLVGLLNFNPAFNVKYFNANKKSIHINYELSKKLTWSDYKIYNGNRREAALTATEISYHVTQVGDQMNVTVSCVFDKSKSNVLKRYKNDYILNHEQKHFDISYLFAMKFINELKKQSVLNYEIIDNIYNNIFIEWNAFQNKYDEETKNSVSKEMQSIWDKKIIDQLNSIK
jgi:hypothetical protein